MIKVVQDIQVYEEGGEEVPAEQELVIGIDSHYDNSKLVVVRVGEKTYAVMATDLTNAIDNAQNINR